MVIEVSTRGAVCASLGTTAIELEPKAVSQLIELYREAQKVALWERGQW